MKKLDALLNTRPQKKQRTFKMSDPLANEESTNTTLNIMTDKSQQKTNIIEKEKKHIISTNTTVSNSEIIVQETNTEKPDETIKKNKKKQKEKSVLNTNNQEQVEATVIEKRETTLQVQDSNDKGKKYLNNTNDNNKKDYLFVVNISLSDQAKNNIPVAPVKKIRGPLKPNSEREKQRKAVVAERSKATISDGITQRVFSKLVQIKLKENDIFSNASFESMGLSERFVKNLNGNYTRIYE